MKNLYLILYLIGEGLNVFPLRSRTRQEGPLSTYLFNVVLEVLPSGIRQEKIKIKSIQMGKKRVKCTLFVNNIIIYLENPIQSTKNLLELVSLSSLQDTKYKTQLYFYVLITNIRTRFLKYHL